MLKLSPKIYTGLPRADVEFELLFQYEKVFVILYDLDLGNRSVTNDMEATLGDLKNTLPGLEFAKILYKDSTGCFDEIVVHADGSFNFKTLSALDLEEAFEILANRDAV